jgi:hypothetical protein
MRSRGKTSPWDMVNGRLNWIKSSRNNLFFNFRKKREERELALEGPG